MEFLDDRRLVERLLLNDAFVIRFLFFRKCTSLFSYIISNVYHNHVDRDELINEFYLYLQADNWYKLRQFDFRSKLTTWLSVVAVRFFIKKRMELIDTPSEESLYLQKEQEYNPVNRLISSIDVKELLSQLPNIRYRNVVQALILEEREPLEVAKKMNITVDNLYNIKRRALLQLAYLVRKEMKYV